MPTFGNMATVVVVPTYDESATVTTLLDRLVALPASPIGDDRVDVLVVDDSSPDGTADVVRAHPLHGLRVHLLVRASKDGLGSAYRAGFARALEDGYDVVVQMDADGSHPVDELPALLARLDTSDLVIGSRYTAGGRTRDWPRRRRALSRAANVYARRVLRLRTADSTSGFRAWRSPALGFAGVLDTSSSGYGFQVENTWRAERAGLRVTEHPFTFSDRTVGTSKMTLAVALEAARLVLVWRLGELVRNPFSRRPSSPVTSGPARPPAIVRR